MAILIIGPQLHQPNVEAQQKKAQGVKNGQKVPMADVIYNNYLLTEIKLKKI